MASPGDAKAERLKEYRKKMKSQSDAKKALSGTQAAKRQPKRVRDMKFPEVPF